MHSHISRSSYLTGQWYLNRYRDDFSQEAAVEGDPEHARITVGVDQRHLPRQSTLKRRFCMCRVFRMRLKVFFFLSYCLTLSPGLRICSFLVPSLFRRVYASFTLRLHSFPAGQKVVQEGGGYNGNLNVTTLLITVPH